MNLFKLLFSTMVILCLIAGNSSLAAPQGEKGSKTAAAASTVKPAGNRTKAEKPIKQKSITEDKNIKNKTKTPPKPLKAKSATEKALKKAKKTVPAASTKAPPPTDWSLWIVIISVVSVLAVLGTLFWYEYRPTTNASGTVYGPLEFLPAHLGGAFTPEFIDDPMKQGWIDPSSRQAKMAQNSELPTTLTREPMHGGARTAASAPFSDVG